MVQLYSLSPSHSPSLPSPLGHTAYQINKGLWFFLIEICRKIESKFTFFMNLMFTSLRIGIKDINLLFRLENTGMVNHFPLGNYGDVVNLLFDSLPIVRKHSCRMFFSIDPYNAILVSVVFSNFPHILF